VPLKKLYKKLAIVEELLAARKNQLKVRYEHGIEGPDNGDL
jgi:hypothetical protein